MLNLRFRLTQPGVLIADGATGTALQKACLPRGTAPESWNFENPAAIRNLYRSYIQAGSDLILTNSFGGTRARLERDDLADQVVEINRQASALAKEMAGDDVYVLGDIGPLGKLLSPLGPIKYDEAVTLFQEQANGLFKGNVDGFLIETMADLNEAKAAVDAVRKVADIPVLVTMSFDTHGFTMMGISPGQAVKELSSLGVDVIGANCGRSLSETLTAIHTMRQTSPEAILMAKPNAGLPRRITTEQGKANELIYDVTPEEMAQYALRYLEHGVKIFGGCCGTTSDHIQAIAKALKN